MNLASCDNCGVVLDKDKLGFPEDIRDYDYCVDESKAVWDGDNWVAFTKCPVCEHQILQK